MSEPTVLETTVKGRCPIRNEGHRCNQRMGHEGLHSAFGHLWGGVAIVHKGEKIVPASDVANYLLDQEIGTA